VIPPFTAIWLAGVTCKSKKKHHAASSGLVKLFRHAGLDPAFSVLLFWIPAFALDSTPPRTGTSSDAENTL